MDWLTYFFGGFLSNRRSAECQWRSLGNTFLGALLAFVLMVCGLTWGYQASFGTVYQGAEEFRSFLYQTVESVDVTVENGVATGDARINTYVQEQEGYQLIVDLRETDKLFDDFTLMCKAENRPDISYEDYLTQPAHIQQDYTEFDVVYSGNILDVEKNYPVYHEYLLKVTGDTTSALYNAELAESFTKLEQTKPEDYYEQIYLLYVSSYYPELTLSEYGAKAPTLHGYYFGLISGDPQGKLLAIFRDKCYAGFVSGARPMFIVGNYSGITALEGTAEEKADMLIQKVFASSRDVDYMMYVINVMGLLLPVIAVWLIMMILVRILSRKKGIEASDKFGSAAQLVGSFLFGGGVITAVLCFLLSFLLSQSTVYYLAAVFLCLTLIVRSCIFLADKDL